MKILFALLTLACFSPAAFAEGKVAQDADAQAINSACAPDAATAGCGTEQVGTGLLKCLHSYKKAHKDFKFSDACKEATKKRRADHKEKK